MATDQIIIYQTTDGITNVDVTLVKDTVWLTLNQLSHLFGRDKSVISRHLKKIYEEGELDQDLNCCKKCNSSNLRQKACR